MVDRVTKGGGEGIDSNNATPKYPGARSVQGEEVGPSIKIFARGDFPLAWVGLLRKKTL